MWQRANHLNDFTANVLRNASRAAQYRRAVELPSGKIVEFMPPVGDNIDVAATYLARQAVPANDATDPREDIR